MRQDNIQVFTVGDYKMLINVDRRIIEFFLNGFSIDAVECNDDKDLLSLSREFSLAARANTRFVGKELDARWTQLNEPGIYAKAYV